MKELVAVVGASLYAFVFTYVMLKLIDSLRMCVAAEDERQGWTCRCMAKRLRRRRTVAVTPSLNGRQILVHA